MANKAPERPTKAFRTNKAVWDKFQEKTQGEGVSYTDALNYLIEGYVQGYYQLPERKLEYPGQQEK